MKRKATRLQEYLDALREYERLVGSVILRDDMPGYEQSVKAARANVKATRALLTGGEIGRAHKLLTAEMLGEKPCN